MITLVATKVTTGQDKQLTCQRRLESDEKFLLFSAKKKVERGRDHSSQLENLRSTWIGITKFLHIIREIWGIKHKLDT